MQRPCQTLDRNMSGHGTRFVMPKVLANMKNGDHEHEARGIRGVAPGAVTPRTLGGCSLRGGGICWHRVAIAFGAFSTITGIPPHARRIGDACAPVRFRERCLAANGAAPSVGAHVHGAPGRAATLGHDTRVP